jgi:hypothetical protein
MYFLPKTKKFQYWINLWGEKKLKCATSDLQNEREGGLSLISFRCSDSLFIIIYYSVYQTLSGDLGGAMFMQGSGPTLADLLQSIPGDPYTEGESLFADLAMTVVSQYCSIN